MPQAKQSPMEALIPNRYQIDGVEHADLAFGATEQVSKRARDGETAAEHDWLATLDLVRQASRQVRQTDAAAKNLARNAQAFIHHANQVFAESPAEKRARPSLAVLAGLGGIGLSWLAMLWFVFADEPFLGLKASSPAVTRHHLISLAQGALFTSLAVVIASVLQRGFGALTAFHETVLNRAAYAAPSPIEHDRRKQAVREGDLGGRRYVLFGDGSVDLETVFGVRSFSSLAEAQEFIGGP